MQMSGAFIAAFVLLFIAVFVIGVIVKMLAATSVASYPTPDPASGHVVYLAMPCGGCIHGYTKPWIADVYHTIFDYYRLKFAALVFTAIAIFMIDHRRRNAQPSGADAPDDPRNSI